MASIKWYYPGSAENSWSGGVNQGQEAQNNLWHRSDGGIRAGKGDKI